MSADIVAGRVAFRETYGSEREVVAEAPGRVNLIGEHTDYNLGFVLPAAIDRTVAVLAAPSEAHRVRARALDVDACDEFPPDAPRRRPGGDWRNYVRGIAWAFADAGRTIGGCDLLITGDVPRGAGLSSSAAIGVAVAGAMAATSEISIEPQEAALLAHKSESLFAGVRSGIMDQFAAALGVAGHALLIDCRDETAQPVALGKDVAVIIIDSGVSRRLADTAYNRRREECAQAARLLGVASLREANLPLLESGRNRLTAELDRRARHVITENRRVLDGVAALKCNDLERFGALMYQSHTSLRDDFRVSTAELDLLVELARAVPGVYGSRLTGAGFGGCTVTLAHRDALEDMRASMAEYRSRTALAADMHVCRIVDGLRVTDA